MLPFTTAKPACETIEERIIEGVTSPARLPTRIEFDTVTPETLFPVALSLETI